MALRPDRCWIGLFPLDFGHLIERMFFAGHGKQDNAERTSNGAQANERSHSALPQLSVSNRARKHESVLTMVIPARMMCGEWELMRRTR
jgi:hypothetical protein